MTRATIERWVLGVAVSGAITAGGLGCERPCADYFTCPGDEGASGTGGAAGSGGGGGTGGTGDGYVCPEDPAEGEVRGECGIWVSATHGDDKNAGTQAAPLKSLQAAVKLATKVGPPRIYACGETYVAPVELPAGVSLYGGFSDCRGEGSWAYDAFFPVRATLVAPPGVPALTLLDGDRKSIVAEIIAKAADASEPGGSSIAVFAEELARAEIRRCTFIAGNGRDGLDGDPGDPYGQPAPGGANGHAGMDACSNDPGLGGQAPFIQCESGIISSIGGQGGKGGNMSATPGGEGFQPPDPNQQGFGAGGKAEDLAAGLPCGPGIGGVQGDKGQDGMGGVAFGRLTVGRHYIGAPGTDGGDGVPGQGGGGGGGSSATSLLCSGLLPGGAGGGSGGTGGCGGKGGKGGQAGGSSIGIAMRGSGVRLLHVRIDLGNGGSGGRGGALQPGGLGGLPGQGGMGFGGASGVKAGCGGGIGGNGGNGGNGGGGHGGHSVGIAFIEPMPFHDDLHWNLGSPGYGGDGGNPNWLQGKGQDGLSYAKLQMEK